MRPARRWLLDYLAEADCSAGLPKTRRQPSLRLARCLCMQAVIRSTLGISDAQSRKTSLVQSRRWSSWVNAWPVTGSSAKQKASPDTILRLRTVNRSIDIVVPPWIDRRCGRPPRRLTVFESINDCIDVNANASRVSTTLGPQFCIGEHSAVANPDVEPLAEPVALRLSHLALDLPAVPRALRSQSD